MKLLDVSFRDAVRSPNGGTLERHYRSRDYELTWEAGAVTITSPKGVRLVPASNVVDMTPAPAQESLPGTGKK